VRRRLDDHGDHNHCHRSAALHEARRVKYTNAPSIGGWRVTCDHADQHLAFYWTP
jgi:hypothetical protein